MESNYAQYIKEREDKHILEDHKGFATYFISDLECYIVDVFVKKEYRKQNVGRDYIDQIEKIAKEHGCKYLTTTVCPNANGSTDSLKATLSVGFNLDSSTNNLIFFRKEIEV